MGQPRGQRKQQHQQQEPAAQPALPDVLAIQRGRFVQWQPAPVLCSAVTADGTVAAVGREDGQIELWDTLSWQLLKVISDGNSFWLLLHWHLSRRERPAVCFTPATDITYVCACRSASPAAARQRCPRWRGWRMTSAARAAGRASYPAAWTAR